MAGGAHKDVHVKQRGPSKKGLETTGFRSALEYKKIITFLEEYLMKWNHWHTSGWFGTEALLR